jgi:dihydrodipicolinate synthase/N-acetylneuraminate lyase
VPPIALDGELQVAREANSAIVRHIEAGGVNILLYGGNANLYNFDLGRYADALAMMDAAAAPTTHVITSIGPDFGKIMDQAPLVERSPIRNVMLLPMAFPADSEGIAEGVRRAAEKLGFGLILYIKRDGYLDPATLEALVAEGAVAFVKYAVERADPANDAYLDAVLSAVGRERVASGMGETPVPDHISRRRLATFTSGAVCIAPAASLELLRLYRLGATDEAAAKIAPFLAFERLRSRLGGIQVLHEAVAAAGIADTGPLLPMLSRVRPENWAEVRQAVAALVAAEQAARRPGQGSGTAESSR